MAKRYCDLDLTTGLNDGTSGANAWQTLSAMSSGVSAGDEVYIKGSESSTSDINIEFPNDYDNPVMLVGLKTTATFGSETASDIASAEAGDTLPTITANNGATSEEGINISGDVQIVGVKFDSSHRVSADDLTTAGRANVVFYDCVLIGPVHATAGDAFATAIHCVHGRSVNNVGEDQIVFGNNRIQQYGAVDVNDDGAQVDYFYNVKEVQSAGGGDQFLHGMGDHHNAQGVNSFFDSSGRAVRAWIEGVALHDEADTIKGGADYTAWANPWVLHGWANCSDQTAMDGDDSSAINMSYVTMWGSGITNETTYRNAGSTAGLTNTNRFSIELECNAGAQGARPEGGGWQGVRSPFFHVWCDGGGTELTVTVHICNDTGADLDENDVLLEILVPNDSGLGGFRHHSTVRMGPQIDTPATLTDGTDLDWTFGTGFGNAQELSITLAAADAPDAAGWVRCRVWNTAYHATNPVSICVCMQPELS